MPALPASGSTSWYSWANAVDAASLRRAANAQTEDLAGWSSGGSYDATSAVTAAVAALPNVAGVLTDALGRKYDSQGGGIVEIPRGVYQISGPLTVPPRVRVIADGVTLIATAAGACINIPDSYVAGLFSGTNATVEGLTFDGNNIATSGVTIGAVNIGGLARVSVFRTTGAGIVLSGTQRAQFHGLNVRSCGGAAVQLQPYAPGTSRAPKCNNNRFFNCFFMSCGSGIELNGSQANTFIGCTSQFHETGYGVRVVAGDSQGNAFFSCHLENNLIDIFIDDSVDPVPVTSVTLTGNGATAATIQVADGGGTQSTASLTSFNTLTAAALSTALQGLSNVGSGGVTVSGSAGGPYTLTFDATLGSITVTVPASTGGPPTVTTSTTDVGARPKYNHFYSCFLYADFNRPEGNITQRYVVNRGTGTVIASPITDTNGPQSRTRGGVAAAFEQLKNSTSDMTVTSPVRFSGQGTFSADGSLMFVDEAGNNIDPATVDTTQSGVKITTMEKQPRSVQHAITATPTAVANTTTETILDTYTVPAGNLYIGKVIEAVYAGTLSNIATSGTITFQFYVGGTLAAAANFLQIASQGSLQTSKNWRFQLEMACRNVGASGNVQVTGLCRTDTNGGFTTINFNVGGPVNLSSGMELRLTVTFATANAGNSCDIRQAIIKNIDPQR